MQELFETFDDAGRPAGLVPRDVVHATGLWHRSVHVFLFRPDGALYIQQRAPTKDLYPGRWDLSVGEHLRPGEDYLEGALRGLCEELGVTGIELEPLGGERRFRCAVPALGIADHELQAAFRGTHAGGLRPDGGEVAAVRAISAMDLATWIARDADAFTPWFLHELRERPGLGEFGRAASPRQPEPGSGRR
jgi:isopentenyldiphosphate isomerase